MQQALRLVAIDLATKIFPLGGADTTGKMLWRKRLPRHALMPFMAQLPPGRIGLAAWGGAHAWARRLRAPRHDVRLVAPQFVTPFVTSNQNDRRDAEAMAAAVTRPTRRFVPTTDVEQQDIHALHRVRERLIGARTALVNAAHGLMHAYGIVLPKGGAKFRPAVVDTLESAQGKLTALSQEMLWTLVEACVALEQPLASSQEKREALATTPPEWQRLRTIPGSGPLTATALVAAGGDMGGCKTGRQVAAW
jgi:transposase